MISDLSNIFNLVSFFFFLLLLLLVVVVVVVVILVLVIVVVVVGVVVVVAEVVINNTDSIISHLTSPSFLFRFEFSYNHCEMIKEFSPFYMEVWTKNVIDFHTSDSNINNYFFKYIFLKWTQRFTGSQKDSPNPRLESFIFFSSGVD